MGYDLHITRAKFHFENEGHWISAEEWLRFVDEDPELQLAGYNGDYFALWWSVVRSQQVTRAGRHVAVYLDHQINLEIGVELDAPFAGYGEVVGSATPDGAVATTTHYGPYGQLHEAHEAIQLWCRKNGHTLAGPCWEIYGHWKDEWTHDPTKIRTDVYYLLDLDGSSAA